MAAKKKSQAAVLSPSGTYSVLSNVRHDGKFLRKGDSVQLTDKEAAQLLGLKVVEVAK